MSTPSPKNASHVSPSTIQPLPSEAPTCFESWRFVGRRSVFPWLLTLLLLIAFAGSTRANVLYVGIGGSAEGCDFSNLHNALLVASITDEDTTIHLATDRVHQLNYTIDFDTGSGDITITGEHVRCNQIGPPGTMAEVTSSDASTPALTLNGPASSPERIRVEMRNLKLNANSGPGIALDGHLNTTLIDMEIFGGTSAVEVSDGGLLVGLGLQVHGNTPHFHGAPIHCTGAASEVSFQGEVYDNEAAGSGGGLRIEEACRLSLSPGTQIYDNVADVDGGAIYLDSGATLVGGGDATADVIISGNGAELTGGGLTLRGSGTSATLNNVQIHNNFSEQGAAVMVEDEASFFLKADPAIPCSTPPRCTVVTNNVDTSGFRAVIAVVGGALARLDRVFLEGNEGGAALLHSLGSAALIQGEALQLWNNTVPVLLRATDTGGISLDYVSAAMNSFDDGTRVETPAYIASVSTDSSVRVDASILMDSRGANAPTDRATGDCLIVDTDSGWTITNALVGANPRFANVEAGDLHLLADSPAIDYCDEPSGTLHLPDLDGEARGFDQPSVANLIGPYDLGADESHASFLFRDGFESGNTSAWSDTQ